MPLDIASVAEQWSHVDHGQFGHALYHNMFAMHPEWKGTFQARGFGPFNERDAKWAKQIKVTVDAFDGAIRAVSSDPAAAKKSFHDLAGKHKAFGVNQANFQNMGAVLNATINEVVSGCDSSAWGAFIGFVVSSLI